jgi:hypothetical protein
MRAIVNRARFAHAASAVCCAVPAMKKNSARLETREDKIVICATGHQLRSLADVKEALSVRAQVPALVEEPGASSINLRALSEAVIAATGPTFAIDDAEYQRGARVAAVRVGPSTYKLKTTAAALDPLRMISSGEDLHSIDAPSFAKLARRVLAVVNGHAPYGVLLGFERGGIMMATMSPHDLIEIFDPQPDLRCNARGAVLAKRP